MSSVSRDDAQAYFARVEPLLGRGLLGKSLLLEQPGLGARVAELLAGCRLSRVVLPAAAGEEARARLAAFFEWKNGFAPARIELEEPGGAAVNARLAVEWSAAGLGPHLEWQPGARRVVLRPLCGDPWSLAELSLAAARGLLKLLRGEGVWPEGRVFHGHRDWPWARSERTPPPPARASEPGAAHVLVVGVGSLGSELVRLLRGPRVRWTLVDPGAVSVWNPHRQWFGSPELGRPKVDCLAARLCPAPVRAKAVALEDPDALEALVAADRPDLAVLATGTAVAGALAARLFRLGVPHLVSCAYPRARFHELSVVLPAEGTPCLGCFRGHLLTGPAPTLPDELSAFLYQVVPEAERERAWQELVAEPATPLHTGAAALVAARVALEVLQPREARAGWLQRLLREETTCLLGAAEAERLPDGSWAYGLEHDGQVVRLGLPDLAGAEHERVCDGCGRHLTVAHRQELPEAEPTDEDLALLANAIQPQEKAS